MDLKQHDYFWDTFGHFWSKHYFWGSWGVNENLLEPNHHNQVWFVLIFETRYSKAMNALRPYFWLFRFCEFCVNPIFKLKNWSKYSEMGFHNCKIVSKVSETVSKTWITKILIKIIIFLENFLVIYKNNHYLQK